MERFFKMELDGMERALRQRCEQSGDLKLERLHGRRFDCLLLFCDGMIDMTQCWQILVQPVLRELRRPFMTPQRFQKRLLTQRSFTFDTARQTQLEALLHAVLSGAAAVFVPEQRCAVTLSLPGYRHRAVSESFTEQNVRASREGFTEPLKVNQTLVRRRLKTPQLVFEPLQLGSVSKTDASLVYLADRAPQQTVDSVRARLEAADIEMVLESGFLEPFLAKPGARLVTGIGHTERPDVLCAKLREGRVGVLVDGTPFAILVPYLFLENFQNLDDYSNRSYFASFIRCLKYAAFFVSCFFPGIYVAVAAFNPELIPSALLFNIASSEFGAPLPMTAEALFIHIVYELVREAGLRLPQPVGHSVSLIGALVVGDAAVNAGIVSSPMVMVVALAAICSYTIPNLYEPVAVLRLGFILLGGIAGPLGLVFGAAFVALDVLGIDSYGVPYTSPAVPFGSLLFRDGLLRSGWRRFAGGSARLSDYPGFRRDGAGRGSHEA